MDETPQLYRNVRLGMWTLTSTRLQSHPDEASFQDIVGRTPLHLALFKRAPIEIITSLLSANPDAVTTSDVDGRIPLHYACMYGTSVETVHAIINANKDVKCISHVDTDGWNALHFACYCKITNIDVVKILLQTCPSLSTHGEKCQRTPLHFACLYGCSSTVVQEILQHPPNNDIATMLDKRGRSPLHIACAQHDFSSLEAVTVLQLLLDASRDTVMLSDGHGLNCLDILMSICVQRQWDKAFERGLHPIELSFEIFWWKVTLLVKALYLQRKIDEKEEKIKKSEKDKKTSTNMKREEQNFSMVHETLKLNGCPNTLRQIAFKKHSDNIFIQDEDGNLPLHIAAKYFLGSNNEEVVKIIDALLSIYPGGTKVTNKEEKEPLHLALQSGKRWKEGIISMFRVNPSSICGADLDLKLFPFVLELVGLTVPGGMYLVLREMPDIVGGSI